MREIKFRAWNKVGKYYVNNVQDAYDGVGPNGPFDSFGDALDNDNYVVEQFTGSYDKNGREIYENDILESVGGNTEVVIYIDGRFEPVCWYDDETYEVIGNIHENADLLEGENES